MVEAKVRSLSVSADAGMHCRVRAHIESEKLGAPMTPAERIALTESGDEVD